MPGANMEILYLMPAWLVGLLLLGLLLSAVEIGFLLGRRTRLRIKSEAGFDVGAGIIEGTVLGLLTLLLAFTYAFVASRYEARQNAVIHEAKALRTAYLRAGLLPEPGAGELRQALHDYLDSRVVSDEVFASRKRLAVALAETERLQAKLWPIALKSLRGRPINPGDTLLLQSLNELIDLHTVRVAAGRDRLPAVILLMLCLVAGVSLGGAGFAGGLSNRRHLVLTTTLAVFITGVIFVIIDMDETRGGLICVSQQSLIELQQSLEHHAGSTTLPDA